MGHDVFTPERDGQRAVYIRVYENDEEDKYVEIEGRKPLIDEYFVFDGPRNREDNLVTTLSLSLEGILTVTVEDAKTGTRFKSQCNITNALLTEGQMRDAKQDIAALSED